MNLIQSLIQDYLNSDSNLFQTLIKPKYIFEISNPILNLPFFPTFASYFPISLAKAAAFHMLHLFVFLWTAALSAPDEVQPMLSHVLHLFSF